MKRPLRRHTAPGQAMLISILLLGFLALGFVAVGLNSVVGETQINSALANKELASGAATGCMEQAIDRLGINASYAGNETLTVASSTCTIRPVTSSDGTWTLETTSTAADQNANYRVILSSRSPVTIRSWIEMASF